MTVYFYYYDLVYKHSELLIYGIEFEIISMCYQYDQNLIYTSILK